MCPKGNELLQRSDGVFGRWAWAWHTRRCQECAEVRAAERFVLAYAAQARSWPVPGNLLARCAGPVGVQAPLRPARRLTWAVGVVIVLVLLAPVAGMVMRRPGTTATTDERSLTQMQVNLGHIALALRMYVDDYGAYPEVETPEAFRDVIAGEYLKPEDCWYRPGTQEMIVTYLVPPGLPAASVPDPTTFPTVAIEVLPDVDIVGYADRGDALTFPKGSDWGQGSIPKK